MTVIRTEDELALEAQWDDAHDPAVGVVILCHPHPLEGGTMTAPLMRAVAQSLTAAGLHVLRFNFRSVGQSEGEWGAGIGEVGDVAAAVEAAGLAFPEETVSLAGWSFGATTSLRWQTESESTHAWVGIAPGIKPYRGTDPPDTNRLQPAARLVIAGDRDQFASVDAIRDFADRIGARVEIMPGSDHFFYFREAKVGEMVAQFLGGRAAAS